MKFSLKQSEAHEALKKCMSVAGTKINLPILSCVLIEAGEGEILMKASDLDRWITCRIPAEVTKTGSVAISGKILSGILAKGDRISFEVDAKHKAVIRSGDSVFRISGVNPAEWADEPKAPAAEPFTMDASEWLEASRSVKWAASTEIARMALNGTLLESSDGKITFVATDGRTLSKTTVESDAKINCIIPSSTMNLIDSIAAGGGALVIQSTAGMLTAECGGDKITSKLIDMHYPNFRQVIPRWDSKENLTRIKMPIKPILDALERVGVILGREVPTVTLDVSAEGVKISSRNSDQNEVSATFAAEVDGPDITIGLNAAFLSNPFRRWDAEGDTLDVEMLDPMSPAMIRSGRNEFVIMPMRVTS